MKVVVVGLGYVGTVTAACLAASGHEVWGVDVDAAKVAEVRSGRSPVAEPGLDALVAQTVAGGTLHATTSCAAAVDDAEVSLVCVGTPSGAHGSADLSYLRRAVAEIGAAVQAGRPPGSGRHSVVIRSTVPPGTIEEVVGPLLAAQTGPVELSAAMCPEFLREGTGVADFLTPPMIVVGTRDPAVAQKVAEVFGFLDRPVQAVEVGVAEALKYACNAFHATKVSFANELARLFRQLGVDARAVFALFCQDEVLNISPAYLQPGFAFGGSCLPKDLRSLLHLARVTGAGMPLLAGTLATNDLVVSEVVERVLAIDASTVALLGLSFKTGTDDLRESPNAELAERLIGKGLAVRIYDQTVNPARLTGANRRQIEGRLPHLGRLLMPSPAAALAGADVAIAATSGPAVIAALLAAPPPHLIDLSGRLGGRLEALPGYAGIGW